MSGNTGFVSLIGAGCGSADLITLRGLARLRKCDAVIYDDLIDMSLLDAVPEGAARICMGKRGGRPSASQENISRTLCSLAQKGMRVARLKGGDPFVFGRGGEEALALQAAGIPYEIIPGISSPIAVPALAGIPVTHRGVSRSFHVITARTADGSLPDLNKLAVLDGTLIFLMGLGRLGELAGGLLAAGKPGDTPAAVISGGCAPRPAAVRGTLTTIAERTREAGILPPAVIVVGDTAAMDLTSGSPCLPLSGVRVGLTGTPAFTEKLGTALRLYGAEPVLTARFTVRPLPLTEDLTELCSGSEHWIVFTSANGVRIFFERLREEKSDLRALSRCKFAVIGRATGTALALCGIRPDLCPDIYTGKELALALCRAAAPGDDVLLFRSAEGGDILPGLLRSRGIRTEDIPLYTLSPDRSTAVRARSLLDSLQYLVFASAGGVRLFFEEHGELPPRAVCVCIGSTTAAALAGYGVQSCLTAEKASVRQILRAILEDRTGR